jgi:hypothetical protein
MARKIHPQDPALALAMVIHTAVKASDWGILKDYIEMTCAYLQGDNPLDLGAQQWAVIVSCLRTYSEQIHAAYLRRPEAFPADYRAYLLKLQFIQQAQHVQVYCDGRALSLFVPLLLTQAQEACPAVVALLQAMQARVEGASSWVVPDEHVRACC